MFVKPEIFYFNSFLGGIMKEKSKGKMSLLQALSNNIYVMKLGNEISRSRVIHALSQRYFFTLNGSFTVHILRNIL